MSLAGAHRRHLPPGCRPGRQTRSRRRWGLALWCISGFCVAISVACVADVAAGGSAQPALLLVTVPFSFIPWWLRPRRGGLLQPHERVPRRARGLEVRVAERTLRRGDTVEVTVRSRRDSLDGVQVGLLATAWADHEVGGASPMRIPRPFRVHGEWAWLGAGGTVRMTVPTEGPFSYEGRHLSTAWSLVARLPSGRVAELPLWVEP